jgi:hypothetical protein
VNILCETNKFDSISINGSNHLDRSFSSNHSTKSKNKNHSSRSNSRESNSSRRIINNNNSSSNNNNNSKIQRAPSQTSAHTVQAANQNLIKLSNVLRVFTSNQLMG